MTISSNEVTTLVDLLEAVAAGAATPNHAATAGGLAARFRARQAPTPGDGAPVAMTRIDPAAILKRRAAVEQAMAARPAARLRDGRE